MKTSKLLKMYLISIGEKSFDDFQMQLIMRTVEHCCLGEPFGKILNIAAGCGGRCGAKFMLPVCLEYMKKHHPKEAIPEKMKDQLMKVDEWLVIMRNDCARN